MVGKTLGKYRIVEKIGRGGMGIVYRGVDETLDRQVAIKVIAIHSSTAASAGWWRRSSTSPRSR